MHASLKQIVKMRVLSSLVPLFDSPKLDRDLRNKVRATFKEFCTNSSSEGNNNFFFSYQYKYFLWHNS